MKKLTTSQLGALFLYADGEPHNETALRINARVYEGLVKAKAIERLYFLQSRITDEGRKIIAGLSVKSKDDRFVMAGEIARLARALRCHALIVHNEKDSLFPRRIQVSIKTSKGLEVTISFDGQSPQPDVFVCPWVLNSDTLKLLGPFPAGEPNPFHKQKCTTAVKGFSLLRHHVVSVLTADKDGWLYQEPKR